MRIYSIDSEKFSTDVVLEVCKTIEEGGVALLPFDTCYGFCCDATSQSSLEAIFSLKKRELSKNCSVFVADYAQIEKLIHITPRIHDFICRYMPGSVTLVAPKKEGVGITSNPYIGIRLIKDGFITSIAKQLDRPLVTTSANLSGEDPYYGIPDFISHWEGDDVDVIVDGGQLSPGSISTIVQIDGDMVSVLREGIVDVTEFLEL